LPPRFWAVMDDIYIICIQFLSWSNSLNDGDQLKVLYNNMHYI
jgi:hypothetical protein